MRTSSSLVQLRRAPSRPRRNVLALLCATALLSGLLLLATVASGANSTRAGAPGAWSSSVLASGRFRARSAPPGRLMVSCT